jgi:predicted PurR-regulated permease PerM
MPASIPYLTSAPTDSNPEATITTFAESIAFLGDIARNGLGILLIMMIAFYWTLEVDRLKKSIYLITPLAWRDNAKDIVREIEKKVSRFIVGQGLLCLIIGGVSLIAYLLIGLPYALTLAILAGIMEAVPFVGPTLAAIPTVAVAFAVSPTLGVWALLVSLIIQMLENQIIYPRVMKNSVGVNPIFVLMSLLALGTLFGVLGALVAIPIAATLQIVLDRTLFAAGEPNLANVKGRGTLSRLRYETQDLLYDIRGQLQDSKNEILDERDQIQDSIEAIVLDLDSLLANREEMQ